MTFVGSVRHETTGVSLAQSPKRMRIMRNSLLLTLACTVLALCSLGSTGIAQSPANPTPGQEPSGPFGLHRGMTKAQVLSIIGNAPIKNETPNALGGTMIIVSTVPKPYREFEAYQLYFSKTEGLLKIIAIGKDIATSEEGTELREHYSDLETLLTNYLLDSERNRLCQV